MVSKSQIKLIRSLHQKKFREKTGLFVAEGPKIITDLIESGIEIHSLFSTEISTHKDNLYKITPDELQKISNLKTANTSLALFRIPTFSTGQETGLIVALDAIRDPGNLGTIIRLCDWFGVKQLICSQDTVDCFNPKVIQATMGSIARVQVLYEDLAAYIKKSTLPVYGACMDGVSIYSKKLPKHALVILGNEANGISEEIMNLIQEKITIPQFGEQLEAESLNVATATSIILSEFKRSIEK